MKLARRVLENEADILMHTQNYKILQVWNFCRSNQGKQRTENNAV